MDENKLFALCWKLAAVVAAVMVITAGGCTIHERTEERIERIAELASMKGMVEAGATPIAARCAVRGGNDLVCYKALGSKR